MKRDDFFFRGEKDCPRGKSAPTGKFGRMFPELQPLVPSKESLEKLGQAMVEITSDDPNGDNDQVPAGYTYFGQFVDHDITFDTTSLQDALVDPMAIENFRSPALDLDSLYGSGPAVQPYLYEPALGPQEKFLIGTTTPSPTGRAGETIPAKPNDLPRVIQTLLPQNNLALTGDPRNDENLIVAQLHLAFLKFHNKIVDGLRDGSIPRQSPIRKTRFEEARDLVIWHYQWIVLHDFLRRILDPEQLDRVLTKGRRFYKFKENAFIPVEFAVAAYRLGHSMVRANYDYNRVFTPVPSDSRLADATLEFLFEFTAKSGNPTTGLGLNPTLPSNWIIDWRRFFKIDAVKQPGLSRKLDPYLAKPLTQLPNVPSPNSLAVRNLLRGRSLALPAGQSVAKRMGFQPLCPDAIATSGPDGVVAKELGFHQETPLWYYILKEAQIQGEGKRLGQVGSRMVAEVFVGLLEADSSSFLVRNPAWKPTLLAETPGTFTMADLMRFVGDVNPIGD